MKKALLMILLASSSLAGLAQCPVAPPPSCTPIQSVPLNNGNVIVQPGDDVCITSAAVIPTQVVVNAGGRLYDQSGLTARALMLNSTNGYVICSGATTTVDTLVLNGPNAISAPTTGARVCVKVNRFLSVAGPQSLSPNLTICLASGAVVQNGTNLSGATLQTNCVSCGAALPVKLMSFAYRERQLTWSAYEDVDAVNYVIERSPSGEGWLIDGSVNATRKPGINSYSYDVPEDGSLYRLRAYYGSTSTYSHTVKVPMRGGSLFTVAVKERKVVFGSINYDADVLVEVVSFDGRMVARRVFRGGIADFAGLQAAPGIYVVRVRQGAYSDSKKIIFQ